MEKTYFCFECQEEMESDTKLDECKYCGTSDIMDITEEVEAQRYFEEAEEEITAEDLMEWQYGNDYHRFVK